MTIDVAPASPAVVHRRDGWARRTAVVAAGQSAVKGGQLVIAVVLVHALDPHDWTGLAYLLSIHLAAVTLGTGNLQQGLVFFLPRTPADRQRALIARTAILLLGVGTAIGTGLVLVGPWITSGTLAVRSLLPVLGLAIALELPTACAPPAFVGIGATHRAAAWDASVTAVMLVCVLVPAAAGWGAEGVVVGLAVQAAVRALAFLVVITRQFPGRLRVPAVVTARAQLRYGLPLGLTLTASVLNRSVDKWFVAAFDGSHVGVHAIAAQEIPLLAVLPYAGGAVTAAALVEAFRSRDLDTAARLWMRQTATMCRVVVPMTVGLVLLAPDVFRLLLPAEYAIGVVTFRLFTIVTVHRVAEYGLVLRAADRNRDVLRSALVLLGSNAVFAFVGARWWGMTGAAAGTLVANLVGWVFVVGRVGAALERSWRRAFPWGEWAGAVVIAAAAATVTWLMTRHIDALVVRLMTATAMFAVVDVALHVGGRSIARGRR